MSNAAATVRPAANIALAPTVAPAMPHTVPAGAAAYWTDLIASDDAPNSDLYLAMISGAPLSTTLRVAAAR